MKTQKHTKFNLNKLKIAKLEQTSSLKGGTRTPRTRTQVQHCGDTQQCVESFGC